jgi:hypothetical protein
MNVDVGLSEHDLQHHQVDVEMLASLGTSSLCCSSALGFTRRSGMCWAERADEGHAEGDGV